MKRLTEEYYEEHLRSIYQTVFTGQDAYAEPFQSDMQPRLLLYPYVWEPFFLSDLQWGKAIIQGMQLLGEEGFYVTALSRPKAEEQEYPYHWYIPIEEMDAYRGEVISQDNVIYSIHGRWGIICCNDDHAVFGGSQVMADEIERMFPNEALVLEFMDYWNTCYHRNDQAEVEWIPTLLSHIYGREKAIDYYQEAKARGIFQIKFPELEP